ncbi:winged helix-turn-helix transcriptional regulator [Nocardioides bruguierae]|uniref:Helix-turn-helix transcriptional regulator n=1 Tax=Nocardioides bruguierae TaxID=2945102 RepID=A0A9X2IFT2_9ACTN|nr:helix-turn-helix domain-containing protein [Nocardioides bruguierae]MCM0620065.1 helix-turn-helix transcriptional regulator [Nocardioides bruguierae]
MSPTSPAAAALEVDQTPDPYTAACPTRTVLDRVGDRWTMLVLLLLAQRTHRFSELSRAIEGISPKVLTQTLRGLERDGLLVREVHAEVPPRVEYTLTPLGGTLVDAVAGLDRWARVHIGEVEAARAAYDAG